MAAVIKSSASFKNVFQYNEHKLKQYAAQLIHSMNPGKGYKQLEFTDNIRTLEKLTSVKEQTKLNAVHISLNFDPSGNLAKEILQKISETYMHVISFGKQHYLVHQHHEARSLCKIILLSTKY